MSRLTILGTGPLPLENDNYIYSSSNRTWHISQALLQAGHQVEVISFRLTRTQDGRRINSPDLRTLTDGSLVLRSVDELVHFRDDTFIAEALAASRPDGVIGVNAFPASRVGQVLKNGVSPALNQLPFWADMNGFGMGEAQIRSHLCRDNSAIIHSWSEEISALATADVFSAASGRQRYALIGELAAVGRLRQENCGYELVSVIPNAREDPPPASCPAPLPDGIPASAFKVLWVGCYNYQFDTELLFEVLENAMAVCPELHFLSTGGQVDGHNEERYPQFVARAKASRFHDRFHFLGWLEWDQFDALLRAADLGITFDLPCYETEFGARNRLTEMMRVGLPVLSTHGPEIAAHMLAQDAGWAAAPGARDELVRLLVGAASDLPTCRQRGQNARRLFEGQYSLTSATEPLLRWAQNPWTAPDKNLPPLIESGPSPGKPHMDPPRRRWWFFQS